MESPVPETPVSQQNPTKSAQSHNPSHTKTLESDRQTSVGSNPNIMTESQMPFYKQKLSTQQKDIPLVDGIPTIATARDCEKFYCTSCKKAEVSEINYTLGKGSWVWFGCFLIFFPCAACCPFCNPDCRDVVHMCPKCKKEVGRNRFCVDYI